MKQTSNFPRDSPYLANNSLALKKSVNKNLHSNISSNQFTRTLSFDNNQARESEHSSPMLHLQNSHSKNRLGRGDNSQLSHSNQPLNIRLTSTHDGSVNSAVANIFGSADKASSLKDMEEGDSQIKYNMAASSEAERRQNSGASQSYQYYTNQNYRSIPLQSSIQNIILEETNQSPVPKGPSPYRVYSDSKTQNIERIANFISQKSNDKMNLQGNLSIQSQNFQIMRGNLSNPSPNMSLQEETQGNFLVPLLTLSNQKSQNPQSMSGGGQSYLNQLVQESNFNSSSMMNPLSQSSNRQSQQLIHLKNRNHLSTQIQNLGSGALHFRKISNTNFNQSPSSLQLNNQQSLNSQSHHEQKLMYQNHQNQLHQQQLQQQISQMQANQFHQIASGVSHFTLQQLQQHQPQQTFLASSALSMNDHSKGAEGVHMKQLPPLDPKSQQLMSSLHSQSHSRQGKRGRVNTNLGRMEGSSQEAFNSLENVQYNFATEVFERDNTVSPTKSQKFIAKQQKDQGQSIIIRVNSGHQISNKKKNSQSNLSTQLADNGGQALINFSHSNFIIGHASSVEKHKNFETYKSQKSITKQNLNSILNDQQILNMRTQSSQGSKVKQSNLGGSNKKPEKSIQAQQQARQSPYSTKNTADLLSFQEKRHASHGNSRQKKLKSVLQSYQSPQNQNYPSQAILIHKSRQIENSLPSQIQSRFDMNTSPISIINENHLTLNNHLIPQMHGQYLQDEISRRTFQEQVNDQTPKNGSRVPSQMKMQKQESYSKGQKFNSKKKSDHQISQKGGNLKLNLSNIDNLQGNPNDSCEGACYAIGTLTAKSQYPQMNQLANQNLKNIKAATTKGGKKLQINMKKVQGINNFLKASQNTSQITQGMQFITTDDRRLQKYQAKAYLSNQSSENAEFTSARIFHPSAQEHFSLGRISSSTPQHNLFQQSQRVDPKGSRNAKSNHHLSSASNELTGQIIPEILEHRIAQDELNANLFPQVVTDPTQDTSLITDNQRATNMHHPYLDDSAFKHQAENLIKTIESGISEQDIQGQIHQVMANLQEALLNAKKTNISKLLKVVYDEQQQKIESLKRSITQTQSVSPSAYQILKEDNTRQVQLILNLQQKQEKQDQEIELYKNKVLQLQDSLSQKEEQIIKLQKDVTNGVSSDKIKQTEESLKRVTEEMGLLYEQTQDQQKEIKKLKKELKEAQKKEKDYLSVLKNTSEFGKITESTQQLIKMAIEQQNKTNNHNQLQIQQQHQAQLQMGAIISQNATLASQIVSQISPTVPFKIEGFPAYNFQQSLQPQQQVQTVPLTQKIPLPFDGEKDSRNEGQKEIKSQVESFRDRKPMTIGKGVPKLNLKLAMKNTSNLEPDSEEMRGKKLSNLSRYKANLKAEGQASAQKLLQATSSVKGQRHFNFNQSEIENLQNQQQLAERQTDTLSPNKESPSKLNMNTASRDTQVGQGLVSQRQTSYKTIKQSSSKNIRTIISESDKRDEEDELNDRFEGLNQNTVQDVQGQDRLFKESNAVPKLVPPIYMKKLTTNLEQLTQPKMGLDFKNLNKIKDFQDEFMDNFDEFSLSWREAIQKQRRF